MAPKQFVTGDLVMFMNKLRGSPVPLMVIKPDLHAKFTAGSAGSDELFVIIGKLDVATQKAARLFEAEWFKQSSDEINLEFNDDNSVQFWCLGVDGVSIIDRLSLEVVSSRGGRQSRV